MLNNMKANSRVIQHRIRVDNNIVVYICIFKYAVSILIQQTHCDTIDSIQNVRQEVRCLPIIVANEQPFLLLRQNHLTAVWL